MRKPFEGLWNVIRFNWPFYVLSTALVISIILIRSYLNGPVKIAVDVLLFLVIFSTLLSLLVSWHVYDLSGFYKLDWLKDLRPRERDTIVNINAGFDETSHLLAHKFKNARIIVCDFYDPAKHTARSIKRAQKAYPPYPNTQRVSTDQMPLEDGSVDRIFTILSAHEIRDGNERNAFFKELRRTVSLGGQVIVVEHLRDTANFLGYNIGAFHFHSRAVWLNTFKAARLDVEREIKITPFLTAFFLSKHGTAT